MKADKRISDEEFEKVWDNLLAIIEKTTSRSTIAVLLMGVLGDAERIMMAKRLMLYMLLVMGWKVGDICSLLGVGRTTVYKYKNQLEINPPLYEFVNNLVGAKKGSRTKSDEPPYVIRLINSIVESRHNRGKLVYSQF